MAVIDRDRPWGVSLDDDLRSLFEFDPAPQVKAGAIPVEWAVDVEYGDPPYIFKPVRQNDSKVRLRLLRADGSYARYAETGGLIERAEYSSDLRRTAKWRKVTA